MNFLIILCKVPLYLLVLIINCISSSLYKYEKLTEENKTNLNEIFTFLLLNIGSFNQENLRIRIQVNRITKIKSYKIIFYKELKKVTLYSYSDGHYKLVYKRKFIRFTEENKNVLKTEWDKFNDKPLPYFNA